MGATANSVCLGPTDMSEIWFNYMCVGLPYFGVVIRDCMFYVHTLNSAPAPALVSPPLILNLHEHVDHGMAGMHYHEPSPAYPCPQCDSSCASNIGCIGPTPLSAQVCLTSSCTWLLHLLCIPSLCHNCHSGSCHFHYPCTPDDLAYFDDTDSGSCKHFSHL